MLAKLRLYAETMRYMRPSQVTERIARRLRRHVPAPRPAPPVIGGEHTWATRPWREPAMCAAGFNFLNEVRPFKGPESWTDPGASRLWLYNLHYFDDLDAVHNRARTGELSGLIESWVGSHPWPAKPGWEPYPMSLRIVNWIKWALRGETLSAAAADSLALQLRALEGDLETHLLGNHLWANAKALVFGGAFFSGVEADRWHARGKSLLLQELNEQFLSDGAHFELSPMYHATLFGDVLELLELDRVRPGVFSRDEVSQLRTLAPLAMGWLQTMTHPDGQISFFNDAAFDIAPTAADLLPDYDRLVGAPWERSVAKISASGYVRLESSSAVLIADVAAVGPDYLPGHAHADTLSFELSLGGRRVIVNGGTSTYAESDERARQRGTAAHNTVVVDGLNSSAVWKSFRVGRRARASGVNARVSDHEATLTGAHDGYAFRPGRPLHRRTWALREHTLLIDDHVNDGAGRAEGFLTFHPDCQPEMVSESTIRLATPVGPIELSAEGAKLMLEPTLWSPSFGAQITTTRARIIFSTPSVQVRIDWPRVGRN